MNWKKPCRFYWDIMKTEKCNVKEISRQELVVKINEHVNRILRQNLYELKLDEHTANHLMQRKQELRDNLRRAGCGDLEAKKFLVQFIKESLMKLYGFTENTIEQTFLFLEKKSRKAEFCFDEILYYLQKKYEANALDFFMEENGLNPTVSGRYEIDETKCIHCFECINHYQGGCYMRRVLLPRGKGYSEK